MRLWLYFVGVLLSATTFFAQTTNAPPERLEKSQIEVANDFLARDFYDLALKEYQKYLEWFPAGTSLEEAQYRIADCLRGLNKTQEAKKAYAVVQKNFPKGAYFARASFRLGEFEWNENHDQQALEKFTEAADKAESSETRLTARFYQARTLIRLKKGEQAIPVLHELAKSEKGNPYQGFALLELARLTEAKGNLEEAQILYSKVIHTKGSSLLRAEAGLKAGLIQMKFQKWEAAAANFEVVQKLGVSEEWSSFANLNRARAYYQSGQFVSLLRVVGDSTNHFPKDSQAEVDLIYSHSLKILKKYSEAVSHYDQFLRNYPENPECDDVAYERLLCLFKLDYADLDSEVTLFLKDHSKSPGVSKILYLQGDRLFAKKNFSAATETYHLLSIEKLEAKLRPEVLLRYGVSLQQIGKHSEAAKMLTDFVKGSPQHSCAVMALLNLGAAYQDLHQFLSAAEAFKQLVNGFPKASEREGALYRMALLYGELKQYAEMREAFRRFSTDYPKSEFIYAATYWTGWSYFEEKNYTEAVVLLEAARKAKPSLYKKETTSRIILARYYLHQRVPLANEIERSLDEVPIATEIYVWVASESEKDRDYPLAERFYRKLLTISDAKSLRQQCLWGLAKNLASQQKWKEAIETWETYQNEYTTPSEIIATKLELIRAYKEFKDFVKAEAIAEDVLRLQPEGKNSAEARYLIGEIMLDQNKYSEAGKYFLSVAVLYEDPDLTPRSLSRAIQCFGLSGDTNQVSRLRTELNAKFPGYK